MELFMLRNNFFFLITVANFLFVNSNMFTNIHVHFVSCDL